MIAAGPLEAVSAGMMAWYEAKMFIEHTIFFTSDALHILVGMVAWIVIAAVSRRPLSDWRPWLAVLVLLVLNECVDLWAEQWPNKAMQYGRVGQGRPADDPLPTVLIFAIRLRPKLFRAPPGRRR